ncbi:RhoGAP-domain-containing protein [Cylindrobasidium torrendii FP15055 ss-10]|uniref:RhoGAP-domain-containing protein n=1 Tax=Cylindrobasidium torrendii FP15055 ss-10 TaxID=1314674 RepID=A0A0D7BJV3_9AGAR|nr:RhoGAP-domain-containing protein [Cylindrobasidium torrendii FP15055 ss-10]
MDMLLSTHEGAPDPVMAAFEQALNERNVLSSQNSQLWKLIEKQRAGYNQILKELERVRGDRETYKTKLAAVLNGTPHSDRQHHGLHAKSSSPALAAPTATNGDVPTRAPAMIRHHSDEPTTPRSAQHFVHQTHSQEPLNASKPPPTPDPATLARLNGANDSKNSLAQRPSRSDSLPSTSSSSAYSTRASSPYSSQHAHNDSITTSGSRPSVYSRKSSITESMRSVSASSSVAHIQPAPPQIVQSSVPEEEAVPSTAPTLKQTSSPALLAAQDAQARDSRITLPDEARHYITNMVDSPVPSPRFPQQAQKSPLARYDSTTPPPADDVDEDDNYSTGPQSDNEFMDMNDDDTASATDDGADFAMEEIPATASDQATTQQQRTPSPTTLRKTRAAADDFPLPPSTPPAHQQTPPWPSSQHRRADDGSESSQPPTQSQNLPSLQSSRSGDMQETANVSAQFRALPLLSRDLPHTSIDVSHSFVRPNERGKEVLSFIVQVSPGKGKESWKVEKLYTDVLVLDQRIRSGAGRSLLKKIAPLPEGKLWKDHAPVKADQRKTILQNYLQSLISLPVRSNDEVIAFFTTDIMRDANQPVMQTGHKEGYLTKRGKNFGGWKTRYFVLQGPVLEYYDTRGGTHLGSITITGAQIGRQQRSDRTASGDDEKEYRHAFLVVEAKRGPGGSHPRHVLCAESDIERDGWVEMLVRYFSGTYSEEPLTIGVSSSSSSSSKPPPPAYNNNPTASPAHSTASIPPSYDQPPSVDRERTPRKPSRGLSKDDISISRAQPIPMHHSDTSNPKLFPNPYSEYSRSDSPAKSLHESSPVDVHVPFPDSRRAERMQPGQPSSLPDSSPLSNATGFPERANSELGHYAEPQTPRPPRAQPPPKRHDSPERERPRVLERRSIHPSLTSTHSLPNNRTPSPDKDPRLLKTSTPGKISGPMNGAPIPAGFKFGAGPKDAPSTPEPPPTTSNDRREKAKSRSFWGFGRPAAGSEKMPAFPGHVPRAVFGVPLEDALEVATIAHLPAIVFRCIQYLEAKKADQEEGIYRMSGSSAVVKSLRDRYNTDGDFDLVASDEYWDVHAVAGLLKSFLRELPTSILTRELHMRFLAVMVDFNDPNDRIRELARLIALLPIANYSLLRALTAHLILIVQNSATNRMNMRNVGIVFSPTLGIPAGVFSLMLGEFNRVFDVGATASIEAEDEDRRNSRQYSDGAADELLGLHGRTLKSVPVVDDTDGDDADVTVEVEQEEGSQPHFEVSPPDTPVQGRHGHGSSSKASATAASRGLNVMVTQSDRGHRHSRMMGLPASPRPGGTPRPTGSPVGFDGFNPPVGDSASS